MYVKIKYPRKWKGWSGSTLLGVCCRELGEQTFFLLLKLTLFVFSAIRNKCALLRHQNVSVSVEACAGRLTAGHVSAHTVSLRVSSQGQADLLKYAKNETVENLKQIHYAAVSCGLNKPGTENADVQKPRRSLEVIPEKANDETGEWADFLEMITESVTLGPTVSRMGRLLCTH